MSHMVLKPCRIWSSITNVHSENRAQSTVHFQIKGRERSIPWLIDSQRDIGPGRQNVRSREVRTLKVESFGVKEEEIIWDGGRRRRHPWVEMAMGTNPQGLVFSDPYLPKKNPPMDYLFSVTGRDFILNPPGKKTHWLIHLKFLT
jgi:hypothetical protein